MGINQSAKHFSPRLYGIDCVLYHPKYKKVKSISENQVAQIDLEREKRLNWSGNVSVSRVSTVFGAVSLIQHFVRVIGLRL